MAATDLRRATRFVLWAGIAVAAALAGFYISLRLSRPSVPRALETLELSRPENAEPPRPKEAARRGALAAALGDPTSPRPTTVEALIEEAQRVTERLVEAFPNSPDAREVAARLHLQLGDSERAVEAWEKCLALNPSYGYAYHGLATVAAKKGEHEKAVSLFRRALLLNPNAFDTQIALAQALIDLDKMEEAVRLLETNVQADPRPYRGRVLLGMAYLQREEYEKAKENYEAAIAAHPKHANAHFGLATACARLGEDELSKKYMAKFRELRAGEREIGSRQRNEFDDLDATCADVARIYVDVGRVCHAHGSLPEAERSWRRAAALDPANVDCRQALAWMYLQSGRPPQTIGMFEELAEIEPDNLSYPLEIARLYTATGRFAAAEETLRGVCEKNPTEATGYVALAKFLLQEDRHVQEAIGVAQTAVELDPNAANHVLLSMAYERNGDAAKAIEAMAEAVKLAPENLQYQQMYELLAEKAK
jgi:tetratricopeptide (TPR) repeat protein